MRYNSRRVVDEIAHPRNTIIRHSTSVHWSTRQVLLGGLWRISSLCHSSGLSEVRREDRQVQCKQGDYFSTQSYSSDSKHMHAYTQELEACIHRTCGYCKTDIEDEVHSCIACPLYLNLHTELKMQTGFHRLFVNINETVRAIL
jgi:hypothetical protein